MLTRAVLTALFSIILICYFTLISHAAMGLRCSDWLNAYAHMRYDAQTNKYVPANPPGTRPVPKDIDDKSALLMFYVTGIVESYTWLDPMLQKMADIPGIKNNPKITAPAFLDRVAELCRGGLQKELRDHDVLDIVSLHNQAMMTLRAMLVQELLKNFMDAGRTEGAKQR